MRQDETYITVCTPTFNRRHTLNRLFDSLMLQTSKRFVWLVIDDGSTDNTEELIKTFMASADFPIEYHWKPNGGRHTALNYSYDYIHSNYVINIDSDDELLPDAVKNIIDIIDSDEFNAGKYWQISGLCIDSESRKIIGKSFPGNINKVDRRSRHILRLKCSGEKSNIRDVRILRRFPFPVYEDTKFVTENMVWEKIDKIADTYCSNAVFRVYYKDSPDSLDKGKIHSQTRMRSRYYYSVFCINDLFNQFFYNKRIAIAICNTARSAIGSRTAYVEVMKDVNAWYKRILVTLVGYPIGYLYFKLFDE